MLAKFDNFSGAPLSVEQDVGCAKSSRAEIPEGSLLSAITVHKSEGLMLERAIVGLLPREFAPSQTHVALSSRANPLRGLIFEKQFEYHLLPRRFER